MCVSELDLSAWDQVEGGRDREASEDVDAKHARTYDSLEEILSLLLMILIFFFSRRLLLLVP